MVQAAAREAASLRSQQQAVSRCCFASPPAWTLTRTRRPPPASSTRSSASPSPAALRSRRCGRSSTPTSSSFAACTCTWAARSSSWSRTCAASRRWRGSSPRSAATASAWRWRECSGGGGFAVAYGSGQEPPAPAEYARAICGTLRREAERLGFPLPRLYVEPGRAIVGRAGVALYTVGARKEVPGVRTYVSVDGGMADNIRPSLYGAAYEPLSAERPLAPSEETVTIAGRYCESGDLLVRDARLPRLREGRAAGDPGGGRLPAGDGLQLQPRLLSSRRAGRGWPGAPDPPPRDRGRPDGRGRRLGHGGRESMNEPVDERVEQDEWGMAGQAHVVTALRGALERDRLAHAYLFSGPPGVGKATLAPAARAGAALPVRSAPLPGVPPVPPGGGRGRRPTSSGSRSAASATRTRTATTPRTARRAFASARCAGWERVSSLSPFQAARRVFIVDTAGRAPAGGGARAAEDAGGAAADGAAGPARRRRGGAAADDPLALPADRAAPHPRRRARRRAGAAAPAWRPRRRGSWRGSRAAAMAWR